MAVAILTSGDANQAAQVRIRAELAAHGIDVVWLPPGVDMAALVDGPTPEDEDADS